MTRPAFRRNSVTLVLLALTTALVVRSMIQLELRRRGLDAAVAADISYLTVPPLLLLLTVPMWSEAAGFISGLYRRSDLSLRLVISAVAIGILMRVAWWSLTVARASFGWFTETGVANSIGPTFVWQCPRPTILALGIVVMTFLVPAIEEAVHRGYVFRAALRWGLPAAIIISSVLFTVFHKTDTWPTVFVAGVILAVQFHNTGSLWASTITHATNNLLIQFDWRCIQGRWLVSDVDVPNLEPGLTAILVLGITIVSICLLVERMPGAKTRPGQ